MSTTPIPPSDVDPAPSSHLTGATYRRSGWIWVAGAASLIALGSLVVLISRSRRQSRNPARLASGADKYGTILRLLRSRDLNHRISGLKQLHEYTRFPKEHKEICQAGLTDVLVNILAERPDNHVLLGHLTRVLTNLAQDEENLSRMESTATLDNLFYVLQHKDDEVKANVLRCLINISCASHMEDALREMGGLKQLVAMFMTDQTPPSVLLQTTRALFNLMHNPTNLVVATKGGVVKKAVERLVAGKTPDIDRQLIGMVHVSAKNGEASALAEIATKEVVEAFNKRLILYKDSASAARGVLHTIKEILARKADGCELQAFENAFLESDCINTLITVMQTTQSSDVAELAGTLLNHLADSNEEIRLAISRLSQPPDLTEPSA